MDFSGFPAMSGGVTHAMGGIPIMSRMTRGVMKRNVDYSSSVINYLENRIWQRGKRDRFIIQPDVAYATKMVAPVGSAEDPVTAITTKFVKTVYNKQRCPIFCTAWAPDGRRLIAGAASGEFSLWNGTNLNFEALMKSHESSVRSMEWSHNGVWMATTDDRGVVKYWQSNMNNVHSFQAHSETIRGCSGRGILFLSHSFSPTDAKLATCSDDGTVRVFDFLRSAEEFILRGHGADVKCVDWHPRKNLLVSGSKDNQQPIKLWDPKAGQSVSTIHAHKAAVTSVRWNRNGNWLLTASRDHLIKLYDIRTMTELEVLKGHKSDVNTVSWHPVHEKLFTSGGSDGAILFWLVGNKRDIGGMESPHDSFVWSLSWHPLGHMLCSGSNDHTCKFWCRNRPGDEMKDRHSSGGLPVEEIADSDPFESGGMLHSGNISLPPPSRNFSGPNNPTLGRGAWNMNQTTVASTTGKSSGEAPAPLQVLGADIIKEQFGKSASTEPVTGQDQTAQQQPAKSGLFMHLHGGEGKQEDHPLTSGPSFPSPQGFQPHQIQPHPAHSPGGLASPGMRGPSQNFHGPRPPPPQTQHQMQQQHYGGGRRDWGERGPDFRPQFPPHEFSPHRHFRPNTQLSANPFSWQRQDPNRDRANFEDEGARFHEAHNNPYVYRRNEGRLRDPREQRDAPPHSGLNREGDMRRLSQDEGGQDWHHRGPMPQQQGWRQELPHGGGGLPGHLRDREFHDRERKPPTQEHFDQRQQQQQRGPDFGPPRDRNVEQFLHRREGDNWRPPFHQGPQQHSFQGQPPPQGPRFPHEGPHMHPQHESRESRPDQEKMGQVTPTGNVPPQLAGEEQGGHVHDPRSQRPPTSQPQRLLYPPPGGQQQQHNFPEGPQVPNRQDMVPPNLRDGGPRPMHPPHPPVHEPAQLSPQVRDAPVKLQEGLPPHMRDVPPSSREGAHPHVPPPQHQSVPVPPQSVAQFPHSVPPQMTPRENPTHHPPHLHNAPPQHIPLPNREGPPEGLQRPPQHHMAHNAQPQHMHDGPAQHDMIREGPPQQLHNGPHEGPNIRHEVPTTQQIHNVPPPHVREGPPLNSPQQVNAPSQRFDEFHSRPPQGDQFFQGGGQNSPRPGELPPQQPQPPFMPPHSRPGPPIQNQVPPAGPRFQGPAHMGREQDHFHSPQHFQEPQGPPNMHRPPPQHYSGPQPPHIDQGPPREPPHNNFNQFPTDQQRPPNHPGPSDPRRPQMNFPPPDRDSSGPNDRSFPPHLPHHHHHQPGQPHRDGGPLPPQPGGDGSWNQRQFPRDSASSGRFEGNREPPPHDRRSGGGGARSDSREGRDKRERERDSRNSRGPRDRSPKHHSSGSRDGQPAAKRSRSDRDSGKHSSSRRERNSRK